MSHGSAPLATAGLPGLRVWLCPCCRAYGLEIGNVLVRLSSCGLSRLREVLTSILGETLPPRFAITLADGFSLLLTPREGRELAGLLAEAPRIAAAAPACTHDGTIH